MSDDFDPYQTWLGIAPHERPCDFYRLLGLDRFESDEARIGQRADSLMTLLRSMQVGPRARYSQRLLNEVAAARVCLLNEVTRAAYDATLRAAQRQARNAAAAERTEPETDALIHSSDHRSSITEEFPSVSTRLRDQRPGTRRSSNSIRRAMLAIAASIIGLTGLWTIAPHFVPRNQPELEPPGKSSGPQVNWESPGASRDEFPIAQDASGNVLFLPQDAVTLGPNLSIGRLGSDSVATNWVGDDDGLVWKFRTHSSPKLGVFKVYVVYSATSESEGGSFSLKIDDQERVATIRSFGRDRFGKDEFRIAVRGVGGHTLSIKPKERRGSELFALKSVELVMP